MELRFGKMEPKRKKAKRRKVEDSSQSKEKVSSSFLPSPIGGCSLQRHLKKLLLPIKLLNGGAWARKAAVYVQEHVWPGGFCKLHYNSP